jgi:hypothetical protein
MIRKSLNLIVFWDFNVLLKLSIFVKMFEFCLVPPEVYIGVDRIKKLKQK